MDEMAWVKEEMRLLTDISVDLDGLSRQKLQLLIDFYLEYTAHVAKLHAANEVSRALDRAVQVSLN